MRFFFLCNHWKTQIDKTGLIGYGPAGEERQEQVPQEKMGIPQGKGDQQET